MQTIKTIKFIKTGKKAGKILMNQVLYTPYAVGNLPSKFAFIYDEDEEQDGYTHWFNLGGLTYINVPDSSWN